MPLTRRQRVLAGACAFALFIAVVVVIIVLVRKHNKKNKSGSGGDSGGGGSGGNTTSTRIFRAAIRTPWDVYKTTPTADMPTMASAMQTRIQKELGTNYTVSVNPAGLEEMHWLATQRVRPGVHPGLDAITIVPTSGDTGCQTLAQGKDWSAFINPDFTLTVTQASSDYGAFIIESNADVDTLNNAITAASSGPIGSGTVNPDPSMPNVYIVAGDDALAAAPTNAAALQSCSTKLPVPA